MNPTTTALLYDFAIAWSGEASVVSRENVGIRDFFNDNRVMM